MNNLESGCQFSANEPLTSEKDQLLELIASLQERESLAMLKQLHGKGYDTAALLACCMEGVKRVGQGFEKGDYYISALIMAGEIMRQAAEYLNQFLPTVNSSREIGHVLLGTVKGDIHDLGKNILKDMLVCNGFRVTDLGVDVPTPTFVQKSVELDPDFVAISCLLTNCLDTLVDAVAEIRQVKPDEEGLIIVGGNCLDNVVNDVVKADAWFSDAAQAVEFFKQTMVKRQKVYEQPDSR